jgi:putative ABC transport system permease protein
MNNLGNAIRQLGKSPGLTTMVISILALAIGANTTIFSVVDAVMLRPLPYAEPQELVEVQRTNRGVVEASAVSYPDFFDLRRQNHTLAHLVSYHDKTFTLTGVARAVQLDGEVVSWDLLLCSVLVRS